MNNETQIIALLTEIRDNQAKQLEKHGTQIEWYKKAIAAQQRRGTITAIVMSALLGVLVFSLMKNANSLPPQPAEPPASSVSATSPSP